METIRRHHTSHNVGEKNPRAELAESDVIYIRGLLQRGMSQHEVSLLFGVSRSTISHIKTGRRWGKVSSPEMEVSK